MFLSAPHSIGTLRAGGGALPRRPAKLRPVLRRPGGEPAEQERQNSDDRGEASCHVLAHRTPVRGRLAEPPGGTRGV